MSYMLALVFLHCCRPQSGTQFMTCWGDNTDGQLGDGTFTAQSWPFATVQMPSGVSKPIKAITCGSNHNGFIDSTNAVWTWGSNSNGQVRSTTHGSSC